RAVDTGEVDGTGARPALSDKGDPKLRIGARIVFGLLFTMTARRQSHLIASKHFWAQKASVFSLTSWLSCITSITLQIAYERSDFVTLRIPRMSKPLTAIACRNIRAGARRREIPDRGCAGLHLIVQPSGHKSWAVRFRYRGQTRKLTLGPF